MSKLFKGRKFKKLKKELNIENKEVFRKIENRLEGSVATPNIYKGILSDILNMLLEGQNRNLCYKEIIGENLDDFCNEIIENSYKPNVFEKVFRISYLFSICITIHILLNVIFEFLLYKENIILRAINGEVSEINIVYYAIWLISGTLYFLTQDLVIRTRLKKDIIKIGATFLLVIVVGLQNFVKKINITYMVELNYIFLNLMILLIIVTYKIYSFKLKRKIIIN